MNIDERIAEKLEYYGINIEEAAGLKAVDAEEEKLQRERERERQAQAPKLNAKHHYDKDDLISFH
jgi:hypothetical protein